MFDVSFAEVLVVITAAGFLLGKREVITGAKYIGNGLGRVIGRLQGVKVKYEEKTKGTQIYELHNSVRKGLQDMSTIGTDLVMIGSNHQFGSLGTQKMKVSSSNTEKKNSNSIKIDSNNLSKHLLQNHQYQSSPIIKPFEIENEMGIANNINNISTYIESNKSIIKEELNDSNVVEVDKISEEGRVNLSRLILVQEKLQNRMDRPRVITESMDGGADIIISAISESIVAESYAQQLLNDENINK